MCLACTAAPVERLVVHTLEHCSYSRIDKRVTQLISLALLGTLRDLIQNAIDL